MNQPAQRPPGPSLLDRGVLAISEILLLALASLVGIVVAVALDWSHVIPADAAWGGMFGSALIVGSSGLAYLGFEKLLDHSDEPVGPLIAAAERQGIGASVLIALAGVAAALLGSAGLNFLQSELLGIEVEEQQVIINLVETGTTTDLVLLAISAVILAPISEELLFRHMFFRRLLIRAGPLMAWVLPAVAFGLVHGNASGLIIYMWLATVFAYAYLLSGRLWVAMAVHAGQNAFALSLLLWLPDT